MLQNVNLTRRRIFFPSLELRILFYGKGLAIWLFGFPDITHIKDKNSRKSAILNFI